MLNCTFNVGLGTMKSPGFGQGFGFGCRKSPGLDTIYVSDVTLTIAP